MILDQRVLIGLLLALMLAASAGGAAVLWALGLAWYCAPVAVVAYAAGQLGRKL